MTAEERKQAEEILNQFADAPLTTSTKKAKWILKEDIINAMEAFARQEVEAAIAERMPTGEEMNAEVDKRFPDITNPHIFGKQLGFGECYFWFRSRMEGGDK